ncbi:hypothetical protein DIPPA_02207 [Diplonema papillatum]|nr:hypothetical protein DIPPA_02207 [Diplonema papillatum]
MHSRGSLAKALRASGLYEAYAGALEEAQVFDLETLEALTDDDWCELVPSEHHRQQFAEVVQRLRASHHRRHHAATPPPHPTKQPPPSPGQGNEDNADQPPARAPWRPSGKRSKNAEEDRRADARRRCQSPGLAVREAETARIVMRRCCEIAADPAATAAERAWAGSSPENAGQQNVPPAFPGAKFCLKVADTVRVIPTMSRLWKTMGALNAKRYPHAGLMAGRTGEVKGFPPEDPAAVSVHFPGDKVSLAMPPTSLVLTATRNTPAARVSEITLGREPPPAPPPNPATNPQRGVPGDPVIVGVHKPVHTKRPSTPHPSRAPGAAHGAGAPPEGATPENTPGFPAPGPAPAMARASGGPEPAASHRRAGAPAYTGTPGSTPGNTPFFDGFDPANAQRSGPARTQANSPGSASEVALFPHGMKPAGSDGKAGAPAYTSTPGSTPGNTPSSDSFNPANAQRSGPAHTQANPLDSASEVALFPHGMKPAGSDGKAGAPAYTSTPDGFNPANAQRSGPARTHGVALLPHGMNLNPASSDGKAGATRENLPPGLGGSEPAGAGRGGAPERPAHGQALLADLGLGGPKEPAEEEACPEPVLDRNGGLDSLSSRGVVDRTAGEGGQLLPDGGRGLPRQEARDAQLGDQPDDVELGGPKRSFEETCSERGREHSGEGAASQFSQGSASSRGVVGSAAEEGQLLPDGGRGLPRQEAGDAQLGDQPGDLALGRPKISFEDTCSEPGREHSGEDATSLSQSGRGGIDHTAEEGQLPPDGGRTLPPPGPPSPGDGSRPSTRRGHTSPAGDGVADFGSDFDPSEWTCLQPETRRELAPPSAGVEKPPPGEFDPSEWADKENQRVEGKPPEPEWAEEPAAAGGVPWAGEFDPDDWPSVVASTSADDAASHARSSFLRSELLADVLRGAYRPKRPQTGPGDRKRHAGSVGHPAGLPIPRGRRPAEEANLAPDLDPSNTSTTESLPENDAKSHASEPETPRESAAGGGNAAATPQRGGDGGFQVVFGRTVRPEPERRRPSASPGAHPRKDRPPPPRPREPDKHAVAFGRTVRADSAPPVPRRHSPQPAAAARAASAPPPEDPLHRLAVPRSSRPAQAPHNSPARGVVRPARGRVPAARAEGKPARKEQPAALGSAKPREEGLRTDSVMLVQVDEGKYRDEGTPRGERGEPGEEEDGLRSESNQRGRPPAGQPPAPSSGDAGWAPPPVGKVKVPSIWGEGGLAGSIDLANHPSAASVVSPKPKQASGQPGDAEPAKPNPAARARAGKPRVPNVWGKGGAPKSGAHNPSTPINLSHYPSVASVASPRAKHEDRTSEQPSDSEKPAKQSSATRKPRVPSVWGKDGVARSGSHIPTPIKLSHYPSVASVASPRAKHEDRTSEQAGDSEPAKKSSATRKPRVPSVWGKDGISRSGSHSSTPINLAQYPSVASVASPRGKREDRASERASDSEPAKQDSVTRVPTRAGQSKVPSAWGKGGVPRSGSHNSTPINLAHYPSVASVASPRGRHEGRASEQASGSEPRKQRAAWRKGGITRSGSRGINLAHYPSVASVVSPRPKASEHSSENDGDSDPAPSPARVRKTRVPPVWDKGAHPGHGPVPASVAGVPSAASVATPRTPRRPPLTPQTPRAVSQESPIVGALPVSYASPVLKSPLVVGKKSSLRSFSRLGSTDDHNNTARNRVSFGIPRSNSPPRTRKSAPAPAPLSRVMSELDAHPEPSSAIGSPSILSAQALLRSPSDFTVHVVPDASKPLSSASSASSMSIPTDIPALILTPTTGLVVPGKADDEAALDLSTTTVGSDARPHGKKAPTARRRNPAADVSGSSGGGDEGTVDLLATAGSERRPRGRGTPAASGLSAAKAGKRAAEVSPRPESSRGDDEAALDLSTTTAGSDARPRGKKAPPAARGRRPAAEVSPRLGSSSGGGDDAALDLSTTTAASSVRKPPGRVAASPAPSAAAGESGHGEDFAVHELSTTTGGTARRRRSGSSSPTRAAPRQGGKPSPEESSLGDDFAVHELSTTMASTARPLRRGGSGSPARTARQVGARTAPGKPRGAAVPLDRRLAALEGNLSAARGELLAAKNAAGQVRAAKGELEDLMRAFSTVAHALSSSSETWTTRLKAADPPPPPKQRSSGRQTPASRPGKASGCTSSSTGSRE